MQRLPVDRCPVGPRGHLEVERKAIRSSCPKRPAAFLDLRSDVDRLDEAGAAARRDQEPSRESSGLLGREDDLCEERRGGDVTCPRERVGGEARGSRAPGRADSADESTRVIQAREQPIRRASSARVMPGSPSSMAWNSARRCALRCSRDSGLAEFTVFRVFPYARSTDQVRSMDGSGSQTVRSLEPRGSGLC